MTEENPEQNLLSFVSCSYLNSTHGFLKAAQMVSSLSVLICVLSTPSLTDPYAKWYRTVAITGFTLSAILLVSRMVNMDKKYPKFPWLETEFLSSSILTACNYVVACTIVAAAYGHDTINIVVTAFFSFCAIGVYGVDAWLKCRTLKRAERNMQPMIVETTTSVL